MQVVGYQRSDQVLGLLLSAALVACSAHKTTGNPPSGVAGTSESGPSGVVGATGGSPAVQTGGASGSTPVASGSGGSSFTSTAGSSGTARGGDVTLATSGNGAAGAAGAATAGSGVAGMGAAGDAGAAGTPASCTKTIPSSMDCSAPLAPGDRRSCTLGTRQYEVYAGKTMSACDPVALVLDAHGATETAVQQAGEMEFCAGTTCWHGLGSGWKAEADTPGGGFIVVFPQGINNMWTNTDADFMVQIVAEMKKMNNIDEKKVYISGISNGGFLTYWTGCPDSDVFHGMSPNSGGSNCDSVKQPIPVIAFDDMPDFAYQSSTDARDSVIMANHCMGAMKPYVTVDSSYPEAVCRSAKEDTMAMLIPCTQVTTPIQPTVCNMWDQCDGGVEVVFCEVAPNDEHGDPALDGHIIYENNTLLNTPSLAWRFFKRFW